MDTALCGFLLVNKPAGYTSFAVVNHIKRLIGKRVRIGHTGTLDPLATGLLMIAIGRNATKQIRHMENYRKTYCVTGKLFELTDTFDLTGTVVRTDAPFNIAADQLESMCSSFEKSYLQVPPVYSAVKHQGVPLYKIAREGNLSHEDLEKIAWTKQKEVTIDSLSLLSHNFPFFTLEATVSHGTYIRILINDCVEELGTVATLYELVRTKLGPYDLQQSVELAHLTSYDAIIKNCREKIAL